MKQRKQNSQTPILFIVGIGLLLIAVALMLVSQNASTAPTPVALSEEEADAQVPRVSLVEAKAVYDAGSAIFLDVRSVEAHQTSRIPDSINIPLADLEARIAELDPEQWIITYCT
jgi:hypothetical protein